MRLRLGTCARVTCKAGYNGGCKAVWLVPIVGSPSASGRISRILSYISGMIAPARAASSRLSPYRRSGRAIRARYLGYKSALHPVSRQSRGTRKPYPIPPRLRPSRCVLLLEPRAESNILYRYAWLNVKLYSQLCCDLVNGSSKLPGKAQRFSSRYTAVSYTHLTLPTKA